MSELLEYASRGGRCGGDLGIDRGARPRLRGESHAQPAGIGAELGGVLAGGRRRRVLVADGGTVDGVEEVGRVTDAARDPEVAGQPEQRVAHVRSWWDAAAARLEADQSAARCRDANRAGTVAAVGDRHRAGRDQRGGAAAGTADGPL